MPDREFDHIVVGTGSAGAVVAARLSEDSGRTVLALEAGPDYRDVESLPHDVAFAYAVSVKDHDWGYTAEAVPGRQMPYARGKVTGGCSAINGTIALRGLPSDYDEWAQWGNDEWSWEKLLPYFIKLEDDLDNDASDIHGKGGPIPIVRWKEDELIPLAKGFLDAALGLGYPFVEDHNDPKSTGIGFMPMNRRGELRVSSAVGYLMPARGRENLEVRDNALVRRILFEGTKAVGVEYERNGQVEEVRGGDVIVCAGTVHTPPLLWRSGVGPADELRKLGIDVVLDQPYVGENLIEHSQSLVGLIPKQGVVKKEFPDVQILTDYTAPDSNDFNDMQIYCVHKLGKERLPKLVMPPGIDLLFAAMCVINRPNSRGRIAITSADPSAAPDVTLNLNVDREDMTRLMDGVRRCWAIAHSKEVRDLWDGIAILDQETIDDDDALAAYIRDNAATIWHPVGTTKMGPDSDPAAVVDQHLRVRGLEGVRIADASVMPNHVSRNPNLTCFVIGERVADWLKAGD